VHERKDLPTWHPLVSKTAASVEAAGMSIRGYARKESKNDNMDDLEDFILEWLE
jgi:uncharacterized cysteine cluster protein YcgN (CxxCxxCC family)